MHMREAKRRRADGSAVSYLQRAQIVWDPTKRRSQARVLYNCGRANDPEV